MGNLGQNESYLSEFGAAPGIEFLVFVTFTFADTRTGSDDRGGEHHSDKRESDQEIVHLLHLKQRKT